MDNILVVVQARENSRRLPGKIRADIAGRSMLEHVLHRARQIGPETFVATPPAHLNEDDVLGRFHLVAQYYPHVKHFVRVTADCPLLDIGVVQRIVSEHLRGGWDFTGTSYWLDGLDVECFTRAALELAHTHDYDEREHVTKWMREGVRHAKFINFGWLHTRWSVNTQDDLDWVRRVMSVCEHCREGVPHHTNARDSIGGDNGRWPVWDLHAAPDGGLVECTAHDIRRERMTYE